MKNPYEVLGVPESASEEQIKSAYRALAKKYHPDNYSGSPLADVANEKMQEINEAYDAITSGSYKKNSRSSESYGYGYGYSGSTGYGYGGSTGYSSGSTNPVYAQVRTAINRRRYDEAEAILNGIPSSERDAEWNFLKGQIFYAKGWFEKAASCFDAACSMDPHNPEYAQAYNRVNSSRSGGFRTERGGASSSGTCNLCSSLLCADCCCECMGGDLIPCC